MLYLLDKTAPTSAFPDPMQAENDPNGLLAIGGDLSPQRLINAYRQGVFPWYNEGDPILWWSPDPRMVLYPADLRISRSLRKTLRRGHLEVSMDQAFGRTIRQCAAPRRDEPGTWLQPEMINAYEQLHAAGQAHSIETWQDGELVGGLYGIAIGGVFFGESMFSRVSDASKTALAFLTEQLSDWGFQLIDCQVYSDHLASLGATEIPRVQFQRELTAAQNRATQPQWVQPRRDSRRLRSAR